MKVCEFGTQHDRTFVMFQCAAEPCWVFRDSAEAMARDCHVYPERFYDAAKRFLREG